MDDAFFYEEQDTSFSAELSLFCELLKKLPSLVLAQTNENNLDDVLLNISKEIKTLSSSSNKTQKLKTYILLLEAKIKNSEEEKDIYLQTKRANYEILNVFNDNALSNKFSKTSALNKEVECLKIMVATLKHTHLIDYMNKRYEKQLKDGGFAKFSKKDLSVFFSKLRKIHRNESKSGDYVKNNNSPK